MRSEPAPCAVDRPWSPHLAQNLRRPGEKSQPISEVHRRERRAQRDRMRNPLAPDDGDGGCDVGQHVSAGGRGKQDPGPHREGRCRRRRDERAHEERRHELACAHLPWMLLEDADLPVSVLPILPPQRPQRRAAVVDRFHVGGQQQPRSHLSQAVVVFIVLVADELGVVRTGLFDDRTGVCRKRYGVCLDRTTFYSTEGGITDAEFRAHRGGDHACNRRLAHCLHRSADAVCAAADVLDASPDIVRRDLAVAVHPHDDLAARLHERTIQSRGDDALRVADEVKIRVRLPEAGDPLRRVVLRVAVGDDHFHPIARIILSEHGPQTSLDERAFVPHGQKHRNHWQRGGRFAHDSRARRMTPR